MKSCASVEGERVSETKKENRKETKIQVKYNYYVRKVLCHAFIQAQSQQPLIKLLVVLNFNVIVRLVKFAILRA